MSEKDPNPCLLSLAASSIISIEDVSVLSSSEEQLVLEIDRNMSAQDSNIGQGE
jgi:hypothetical protein